MGDRGNIIVIDEDSLPAGEPRGVVLYTHWSGSDIKATLRTVLSRRQRWDYPAYLARMVFCEMVRGHEYDEAGFGISSFIGDNEYPFLVVDVPRKKVVTVKDDGSNPTTEQVMALARTKRGRSFEDFVAVNHTTEAESSQ